MSASSRKSGLYVSSVEWVIIGCLALMTAVTFASTAIRFLMTGMGGIYWAEEVTRYTSIWMVFLGAALGVRYGVHLHVDLITSRLPPFLQKVLRVGSCLLMLVFEGVLLWFGAKVAIDNMEQQSSSLLVPMGYVYAAIPVGALLMIGETLRALVRTLRNLDPVDAPDAGLELKVD